MKEAIVYQMGKVGSTSIVASIVSAGIPAYQSHFLDTSSFHEVVDMFDRRVSVGDEAAHHISVQLQENLLLRNKLIRYQNNEMPRNERLGIITLVRDPLDWYFSNLSQNFFQVETQLRRWLVAENQLSNKDPLTEEHLQHFFTELFSCFDQIIPDMNQSHSELIQGYFNEAGKTKNGDRYRLIYSQVAVLHRIHFWFDKHFASLLDIDVLRYGFDKFKGYSVFQRGNVDIMLMKFEQLNALHSELSEFLGLPRFNMKRLNESKDKSLGQLISKTRKNLYIPDSFKKKYFSSEYYETFYREETTDSYRLAYSHLRERRRENKGINLTDRPIDDVSNYHEQKKTALESFVAFTGNGKLPEWPLELSIEVSNQCDMACAMCPSYSPLNRQKYQHLPASDRGFLHISDLYAIDDMLQHAIIVHLGGYGEPTQHPKFKELISYLSRFEVLVDFSTHALNLTEALCDHLVKHGVYRVNINLSGATREDYESIYVGSDFEQVLNNISLLAETKNRYGSAYPIISVNSIAFDFHLEKLPLFVETVAKQGAEVVVLKPLNTYDGISQVHKRAVIMDPHKHTSLLDQALEIARQYKVNLVTNPFTSTVNLPGNSAMQKAQFRHKGINSLSTEYVSLKQIKSQGLAAATSNSVDENTAVAGTIVPNATDNTPPAYTVNNKHPCFEPFKSLNVTHDGRVYPCSFGNRDAAMGKLGSASTGQEIWHNPLFSQLREHALIQELPETHCSGCIESNSYPKQHNIGNKVQQYSKWFYRMFNMPFHLPVKKSTKMLRTNEQIIKGIY